MMWKMLKDERKKDVGVVKKNLEVILEYQQKKLRKEIYND